MKSPRKAPNSQSPGRNSVCWCGNDDLKPFSDDYARCSQCETLVLRHMPTGDVTRVRDDSADLYGRNYYLKHLQEDFGYPDLKTRARADLPERCLHWLRATLKYKIPPGKALELGSAHGAFVALLGWTGFDTTGLELSPWVVNFAKSAFGVPVLAGPIEDQSLAPRSLDVIALMDVLEHLPSPLATMERCLRLLKADGVLIIQTPRYPEGGNHEDMIARQDPFLEQLKSSDHLYLYSQKAVQEFLRRLGSVHVAFEPAIFAHYDMFLVASQAPLSITSREQIETVLSVKPAGRLVQALLDTDDRSRNLQERLGAADADRAARLEVIQQQGQRATELEGEVHHWLEETKKYSSQAQQSESLRTQLNGLQAELEQTRIKSEALAREKLDLLGQLEKARLDLAAAAADGTRMAADLEQERIKNEALAREKLDLLGQLEKTRLDLAAAAADRTRMSADIARLTDQAARLQAELEQQKKSNEFLTGELQKAREEIRDLTAHLDVRSRALEGTLNSLEAARVRVRELQTRLSEIEEHRLVRFLKACRLWPW